MKTISKPLEGEHSPYYNRYIDLVPNDGLMLQHLRDNLVMILDHVRGLPEDKLTTPHAPDEWTVQDILAHLTDTERIFSYRALRIARNDTTSLPGFEQNDFAPYTGANSRSLDSMLEEYSSVRAASLTLFNSFDDAAWVRVGRASDTPMSVRAAAYIIAGHELYHLKSIKENYG
jgi:hypothetical protein